MTTLPAIPPQGTPVTAIELGELERRMAVIIPTIEDFDVLGEWRARARALEQYLRNREMQGPMLGVQRRIEARIGQLLGPAEERARTDLTVGHDLQLIERSDRADFRILARALDDMDLLVEDEWRRSRRALVSLLRQRLGLLPETPPLPEGIFRCIVADPAWQLDTGPDTWGGVGERGHDALTYEQMSLEAIKNLAVKDAAAEDAHLYLWTTNRYVEHAYDVARAWGFEPSVLLVWAKEPHGIGLGDAFRLTTEFILYARRGHLREMRIVDTTWFNWPRGKHSVKPPQFYELVESVTPANGADDRLEMFARQQRAGWTVWGDEVA